MKWKLTARFVMNVIMVVVIVMLINLFSFVFFLLHIKQAPMAEPAISSYGPEDFVRSFERYIDEQNGTIRVGETGLKALEATNTWVQVLDENGQEVYQYNKPTNVSKKHTPFEIVHGYKYRGGIGSYSTILIGEKKINERKYSYIVGYPMEKVDKIVLSYDTQKASEFFDNAVVTILAIDILIALFFGYLFSRKLANPLAEIIEGVKSLGKEEYDINYPAKGVYAEVNRNLNSLSKILKSNRIERIKIDTMREEWSANISHDIKTPLASIKGYAEFMCDEDYQFDQDELKSFAKIIYNKANYIKELVDDLNLSTKLKSGNMILDKKPTNIVHLVKDSIIEILNDPHYKDADIDLTESPDALFANLDAKLMKRVIENVLHNALIHNDNAVKVEVEIKEGEDVRVYIRDNGKGIEPLELEYIFQRYYRGTNTDKEHKGSGLGMAIAKEIVLFHGGEIHVKSIVEEGTEVEIILPQNASNTN